MGAGSPDGRNTLRAEALPPRFTLSPERGGAGEAKGDRGAGDRSRLTSPHWGDTHTIAFDLDAPDSYRLPSARRLGTRGGPPSRPARPSPSPEPCRRSPEAAGKPSRRPRRDTMQVRIRYCHPRTSTAKDRRLGSGHTRRAPLRKNHPDPDLAGAAGCFISLALQSLLRNSALLDW